MKIALSDIGVEGRGFSFEEQLDFPDESAELRAPVQTKMEVRQTGDTEYILAGDLQASVLSSCDRCGREIELALAQEFSYTLRLEQAPQLPAEYNSSEEDCETIYLSQPSIETRQILLEQLLLGMPVHRLCDDSCRGLCDGCGMDLNKTTCQCGEGESDSPFSVLKKISK